MQENLKRLRDRGAHLIEPDLGPAGLGSGGDEAAWRSCADIVAVVEAVLLPVQDLVGQIILVTAGPTREPLDPVRYLSNRSSGQDGLRGRRGAAARGARVILVSGPTALARAVRRAR